MQKLKIVICTFFLLYLWVLIQEFISKFLADKEDESNQDCNQSIFTGSLLSVNALFYFISRIIQSSTAVWTCIYLFHKSKKNDGRATSSTIIQNASTNGLFH